MVAGRFHEALATATAQACGLLAERRGLDVVVLSGGVFQNRLLLERTWSLLRGAGLRVLVPRLLPPTTAGSPTDRRRSRRRGARHERR